jgi:threonine/homoserine/homoserine lactone efflux protein
MALSHKLILIFTTNFVATASPGPDNMAIMRTAGVPHWRWLRVL